jgi:hypothetical protein
MDLVEVFIDLLEAENLKSKSFTGEYPAFMPAHVAAVVHSPEHKSMRINELDWISRKHHGTPGAIPFLAPGAFLVADLEMSVASLDPELGLEIAHAVPCYCQLRTLSILE